MPVVISDGEFPMQSSTNTLTIRVCTCDREGNMKLCNAEALTARAGLSTGALVAILLCVIILLSEYRTRDKQTFVFLKSELYLTRAAPLEIRLMRFLKLQLQSLQPLSLAGDKETVLYFTR